MNAYNLENKLNLRQDLPNSEADESTLLQQYGNAIERELAQTLEQVDRLLSAASDRQIAGFLPEAATIPTQKNNGKCRAYLDLIHALLHCPEGLEAEIVAVNSDLIDSGLVRMLKQMAVHISELGDRETANFLDNFAIEAERQLISAETFNLDWDNWIFG
jgi:hypothetical protein